MVIIVVGPFIKGKITFASSIYMSALFSSTYLNSVLPDTITIGDVRKIFKKSNYMENGSHRRYVTVSKGGYYWIMDVYYKDKEKTEPKRVLVSVLEDTSSKENYVELEPVMTLDTSNPTLMSMLHYRRYREPPREVKYLLNLGKLEHLMRLRFLPVDYVLDLLSVIDGVEVERSKNRCSYQLIEVLSSILYDGFRSVEHVGDKKVFVGVGPASYADEPIPLDFAEVKIVNAGGKIVEGELVCYKGGEYGVDRSDPNHRGVSIKISNPAIARLLDFYF